MTASDMMGGPINFWALLNKVATALQKAAHSETAVYEAFRQEMVQRELRGFIGWLDPPGENMSIATFVFPNTFEHIIAQFEQQLGHSAIGYTFPVSQSKFLTQALQQHEPIFHADGMELVISILPEQLKPLLQQFAVSPTMPGVATPLILDGKQPGLLYLSHPQLTANDSTAVAALGHHLAIAIKNARLFQQLHRNEENLRILAENVPGVIYQCVNNYTFDMLYLNDAVESLTGYAKEKFLNKEISFRDLYHPDDSLAIQPLPENQIGPNRTFHHTYRIHHRSGSWRWVEEIGSHIYDEAGNLLFLEGSIIDITERRQAEMLQSTLYRIATVTNVEMTLDHLYAAIHAILSDLMDTRNFYIALFDEQTGWLQFPYFVDEMDAFDGLPFNSKNSITDHLIQTGQPLLLSRVEIRRLSEAGIVRPLGTLPEIWLGAPLSTQNKVFGAIVVQSYTNAAVYTEREKELLFFVSGQVAAAIQRKRVEAQLRAMAAEMADQARMFEVILSSTLDQFVVYDLDGRITYASPTVLSMWKLSGLVGKTLREVGLLPEDVILKLDQARDEVIRTGQSVQGEVQIPMDHDIQDVEYIHNPVKGEPGRVTAVVSTARDITQRNKTKAALHHAQKMESLGVLAGGVAHDFNNLLVGMMAQNSLALAKLAANSPAVPHIQKATQAAERAAALTQQLLAYSGQGHFTSKQINLSQFIYKNKPLLQATIDNRIILNLSLAKELPYIEGDPNQMQQILINLVSNSSEAIGNREGTITLATSLRPISESDDVYWQATNMPLLPGDYVGLKVHDDGHGMDAATLSRIFEPFFTTKFTGRGLGLAAVLGIVRGHNGGLFVASAPGMGTSFEIIFPVSYAESPTAVDLSPPAKETAVVLVIDDEEPVRDAVIDILEIEQIKVLTAVNGQSGIDTYQRHYPHVDLVLLDLSLPDIRGEQVFAQLKQIDPAVRVILSSGYSESEAIQGFGDGLIAFLQKPYSLTALLDTVSQNLPTHNPSNRF